jgi:hypothetical protein
MMHDVSEFAGSLVADGAGLPLDVRVLVTIGRDSEPAALGPLPPAVRVER